MGSLDEGWYEVTPMHAALASMTGFARAAGESEGVSWIWELRSVNGRGLELRLRLPPGAEPLEAALREAAGKRFRRGTLQASLTVQGERGAAVALDRAALEQALAVALALAERIPGAPPPRAEALLALPGVMRAGAAAADGELPLAALAAGFAAALDALHAARAAEGARLGLVFATLLEEIAGLRDTAAAAASEQPALVRARLAESLRALGAEAGTIPEERLAQEIALAAARADVREELDRLTAHLAAARALLAEGAGIGRRLDFLVQEFHREANTLGAKSASRALTATVLALKAAIEQLREQVQNIE